MIICKFVNSSVEGFIWLFKFQWNSKTHRLEVVKLKVVKVKGPRKIRHESCISFKIIVI